MLKLTSFLSFLVTVSCFANGQSFSLGSDFDPQRYMQTQIPPPLARGDYTNLPQRVVLDKYLPKIKKARVHQGLALVGQPRMQHLLHLIIIG
jgi:hypothetical protein